MVAVATSALNVAVTLTGLFPIIMVQVPVPEQPPPLHPPNVAALLGYGVRRTCVPVLNKFEHVPGQAIPEGLDVT